MPHAERPEEKPARPGQQGKKTNCMLGISKNQSLPSNTDSQKTNTARGSKDRVSSTSWQWPSRPLN